MGTELVLNNTTHPARMELTNKTGEIFFDMDEGKHLKIKNTSEEGHIFDQKVPTGKKWRVFINMKISESDA